MKMLIFGLFLVLISGLFPANAQKLEKVWETTAALKTPESVLFDEENEIIYVANIDGDPAEKDGNGFISILNADGSEKNIEWLSGLDAPKGMALSNGKLYVSDIDRLVEIDVESGKIVSRFHAANAVFLNDVAASDDGTIFISDTRTGKIHRLVNGSLSVWLEGEPLETPNGLFIENGKLYVGDQNIYEVDIESKEVKLFAKNAGGVDGLEKSDRGEFVFSNWPGRVFVHRDGKNVKLLDTTAEEINTADLDFALKPGLVLIPTFFNNKIVAYKIVD